MSQVLSQTLVAVDQLKEDKTMVDRINRSGINKPSYNKSKATGTTSSNSKQSGAVSSGGGTPEQVQISERLQGVIGALLEESPPVENIEKIREIQQAISNGEYEIDHEHVASELMLEYLGAAESEGNENDGSSS